MKEQENANREKWFSDNLQQNTLLINILHIHTHIYDGYIVLKNR